MEEFWNLFPFTFTKIPRNDEEEDVDEEKDEDVDEEYDDEEEREEYYMKDDYSPIWQVSESFTY